MSEQFKANSVVDAHQQMVALVEAKLGPLSPERVARGDKRVIISAPNSGAGGPWKFLIIFTDGVTGKQSMVQATSPAK